MAFCIVMQGVRRLMHPTVPPTPPFGLLSDIHTCIRRRRHLSSGELDASAGGWRLHRYAERSVQATPVEGRPGSWTPSWLTPTQTRQVIPDSVSRRRRPALGIRQAASPDPVRCTTKEERIFGCVTAGRNLCRPFCQSPLTLLPPMRSLLVFLTVAVLAASCSLIPNPPTAADLNLKNNQVEVPLDQALTLQFSRAVDPEKVAQKVEVTPATEGNLAAAGDGKRFTWTPSKSWLEATLYHVFVYPFADLKGNPVAGRNWSFLTTVTPRVVAVKDDSGQQLADGDDAGQGSPLTLAFNTPMSAADTTV